MKLAEALRERKQLQIKMGTLRQKLIDNAIYQEGSKPVEAPAELIKALESTRGELAALIKRINATNSSVKVSVAFSHLYSLKYCSCSVDSPAQFGCSSFCK